MKWPLTKNSFWVSRQGRNSNSVEWKQVVVREKAKFEMKILWGKKKVKWAKRRDGQNMRIEMYYSIKSGDNIYIYKLTGQEMNVIKLWRKENITNHKEDHSGFHLGSLLYLPMFFSFWICLWWCQMLTPSDLRQPVQYLQWSAVTGCLLQLLIWSLCPQQSGLSTIGWARISPGVGAIVSPQAVAAGKGVVCLSSMVAACGG